MENILLSVKILSVNYAERYSVRRQVLSAQQKLQQRHPRLAVDMQEVKEPGEIGRYAQVLFLPSLVVEEQLVCSGRSPTQEEIADWLRAAYTVKEKSFARE